MKTFLIQFLFIILGIVTGCAQHNNQANAVLKRPSDTLSMTDEAWKAKLTPEQYFILRGKGTEQPFSGKFVFTKDKGVYHCAGCGEALFTDDMKFDSPCGWPSFDKEIAGGKIIQTEDRSHGMLRTEITCARCGGHLGHIFDDGPTATGKRYCVNSGSLQFEPQKMQKTNVSSATITLGGGCFWCIEAVFEALEGVKKVESGYSGGVTEKPTYSTVSDGNTGHAEVVQIDYNPQVISLEEILEVFFTLHDPTTLNRQGTDVGTQYRSIILYHDLTQKAITEKVIATLNQNRAFKQPIVTEVKAFSKFFLAENYHQEYYELNKQATYCKAVIQPKLDKLHQIFKTKLKKS